MKIYNFVYRHFKELDIIESFKDIYPWSWTKISKVIIEGDDIRADPNAVVKTYYPFKCYNVEHSVFEDFISVNINNQASIIEFIEKYGFLCFDANEGPVYQDDTGNVVPHFESLAEFKNEYQSCKQISDLYKQYNSEAFIPEEIIVKVEALNPVYLSTLSKIRREMIIKQINNNGWLQENIKLFLMSIIAQQINLKISSVTNKLIINKEGLKFEDSWLAPDLLSMIYQMFYLRITSNKILRTCKNVYCEKNFFILKNDKRKLYCSRECAQQQSMHRYREKNKDEINAKKRANRKNKY